MNHRNGFNPLSRTTAHRRAMSRNMVTSLFRFERITTTKSKALEVRKAAEKLITRGKVDSVHNRREAAKFIQDEKILNKSGIKTIIVTSLYMLVLSVWFLKSDTCAMILSNGEEKYLLSAFFGMFIFAGIFICFLSRSNSINILYGIGKNKSFILIMLLVAILQISFIYFGGNTFRCVPLSPLDLVNVILISFSVVVFDFLRKLLLRLFKKKKIENSILNKNLT